MTTPISEAARQAAEAIADSVLCRLDALFLRTGTGRLGDPMRPSMDDITPTIAMAIKPLIDQAAPAWIATKDRRPANGQFVLAYGDACQGWIGGPKLAVFRWDGDWWDANMDAELAEGPPTHWQPLPPGPLPLPQEGRT